MITSKGGKTNDECGMRIRLVHTQRMRKIVSRQVSLIGNLRLVVFI